MNITIASIFELGLAIYVFLKERTLGRIFAAVFYIYIIIELTINVGYFLRIGSFEIQHDEFWLFILFTLSLVIVGRAGKLNRNIITLILALHLVVVLGFLNTVFFTGELRVVPPYGSWDAIFARTTQMVPLNFSVENVKRILRLTIFSVILMTIGKGKIKIPTLYRAIVISLWINILFGTLDILLKAFSLITIPELGARIFGVSSSQITFTFKRVELFAIQGLKKEPSHYAIGFLPVLIIPRYKGRITITEVISVILMLLSGSLAGYSISLVWFMIRFVTMKRKVFLNIVWLVLLTFLILLFIPDSAKRYYLYRFMNLIGLYGKGIPIAGSETVRKFSMIYSLKMIFRNPLITLFGVGLGSHNAHSAFFSAVSNMGIVGTFLWLLLLFMMPIHLFHRRTNLKYFLILIVLSFFIGDISWVYNFFLVTLLLLSADDFLKTNFELEKSTI